MRAPIGSFVTAPQVVAVEDRSAQLTWGRLGPGPVTMRIMGPGAPPDRELATTGGPGTVTIPDLAADEPYVLELHGPGLPAGGARLPFRTLPSPPGPELVRFATLSDTHFGIDHFDVRQRMREDSLGPDDPPHPVRCARAAAAELVAWGAERLILKGDITDRGRPEEWAQAGDVLAAVPVPVDAIAGNHDVKGRPGSISPGEGARRIGLTLHEEVTVLDLPGLRVVFAPTTIPGHGRGRMPEHRADEVADAAADTDLPVLVVIHHELQARRSTGSGHRGCPPPRPTASSTAWPGPTPGRW